MRGLIPDANLGKSKSSSGETERLKHGCTTCVRARAVQPYTPISATVNPGSGLKLHFSF